MGWDCSFHGLLFACSFFSLFFFNCVVKGGVCMYVCMYVCVYGMPWHPAS